MIDIESYYKVDGIRWDSWENACKHARHLALRDNRNVHIEEKVPGLPIHRELTITPKE